MEIPFINDYFLENNILHNPGVCVDKKAWVLPINISSDFKETKCRIKVDNMKFIRGGTPINTNGISFCQRCKNI